MTPEAILAVIDQKRPLHPELNRPLTWNGLRRVLAREDVAVIITELARREAQLVQYDGAWAILLDSNAPTRRCTYFATHELGHLWLHHDGTCARAERVYNMVDPSVNDPREEDAELFAVFVLGGRRFRRTY